MQLIRLAEGLAQHVADDITDGNLISEDTVLCLNRFVQLHAELQEMLDTVESNLYTGGSNGNH